MRNGRVASKQIYHFRPVRVAQVFRSFAAAAGHYSVFQLPVSATVAANFPVKLP